MSFFFKLKKNVFKGLHLHIFAFCNAIMDVCNTAYFCLLCNSNIYVLIVQKIQNWLQFFFFSSSWLCYWSAYQMLTMIVKVLFCVRTEVCMIQQIPCFGRSASLVTALLWTPLHLLMPFQTYLLKVNIATGEEIKHRV